MRCASCDAELPEGALFCIECGAPAERASTGATERLPERTGGPRCPACGTVNPSFAAFCVNCGRALGSAGRSKVCGAAWGCEAGDATGASVGRGAAASWPSARPQLTQ